MKQLLVVVALAALGWYGWGKYQASTADVGARRAVSLPAAGAARPGRAATNDVSFLTCDGRNQCSQMRSCEEARYFLKNCGLAGEENRESASCEKQWCR
jgi:hypothetical protein